MHGALVVDKPEGPTSHDVVARTRRALGVAAVGHTGTLDPMATGVLALLVGRATRLAQFLTHRDKAYDATLRLGVATDTWDRTGAPAGPVVPSERLPGESAIEACLGSLRGAREQLPPPFSAKKVGGVRAHVLARKGGPVEVKAALVSLHEVEVLAVALPLVDVRLRCSAGYYVRALAHELGQRLGCSGSLERLRRTASGPFTLDQAVCLDLVERDPAEAARHIVPIEALLPEFPSVELDAADARRAGHGNDVAVQPGLLSSDDGPEAFRLLAPGGALLAIARPSGRPGLLHPVVVLK